MGFKKLGRFLTFAGLLGGAFLTASGLYEFDRSVNLKDTGEALGAILIGLVIVTWSASALLD